MIVKKPESLTLKLVPHKSRWQLKQSVSGDRSGPAWADAQAICIEVMEADMAWLFLRILALVVL